MIVFERRYILCRMGIMPNALIVEKWHTEKLELKKNLVIEIWEQEKQFHNLGVVIAVYKDFAMRTKMMIDCIEGAMSYGKNERSHSLMERLLFLSHFFEYK